MSDILYRASIYVSPRREMYLPGGRSIWVEQEIDYHFYYIEQDINAPMRVSRALERIRKSKGVVRELRDSEADQLLSNVLLGLVASPDEARRVVADGNAEEVVSRALHSGDLSPALVQQLKSDDLPFRQSPLSGKDFVAIAKSPTAAAIVIVMMKGHDAPIAIVLTSVGIVAMHVVSRAAPVIGRKVERVLKEWMK